MRRAHAALAWLLLAALAGGCATVGVAEKEAFTWPCMQWDQERGTQGFLQHVYTTQEQADGGVGGEGGGCGCR